MPENRQKIAKRKAKALSSNDGGSMEIKPAARSRGYFGGFELPPVYRKLWPSEVGKIEEHLLRLSPHDRQMRFCGGVSDARIREYCKEISWTSTTYLGCFVDGVLRGVACIIVLPEGFSVVAEIAFSVEAPFQNRGIGTVLVRKAISIARNRYIGTAYLFCLRENGKMRHIKIGMLWIQEKNENGDLGYHKVLGTENPSDMMTKNLAKATIDKLIMAIGGEFREGRAHASLAV